MSETRWPSDLLEAAGTVEGRIEAVSTDGACLLVLEDRLSGRPVVCYLSDEACAVAREAVGHDVEVHGLVQREPKSGVAVAVRDVRAVIKVPASDPQAYLQARGGLKKRPGDPPPEARIRQMRDGS